MNSSVTDHNAFEIDNRAAYARRLANSRRLQCLTPSQTEREGTARLLEECRYITRLQNGTWRGEDAHLKNPYWYNALIWFVVATGIGSVLYIVGSGVMGALQTLSR